MAVEEPEDPEVVRFKNDLAKFSGNYPEFLVIVRTEEGKFIARSSERVWGYGAAARYLGASLLKDNAGAE